MTEKDKGLETLSVWQKAVDFAVVICRHVVTKLPADEKYALASQLRRAAQSVPANIAEGYGRFYYREGIRFCYIARGSLEETYSHLTLAYKLEYLTDDEHQQLTADIKELHRMLNGYISFLKRSRRGEHEPGLYSIRDELSQYPSPDT